MSQLSLNVRKPEGFRGLSQLVLLRNEGGLLLTRRAFPAAGPRLAEKQPGRGLPCEMHSPGLRAPRHRVGRGPRPG